MSTIRVKKSDPPESKEVLASAIVKISKALEDLQRSGLNEEAIIVLLRDKTKVGKRDIQIIFNGLRRMKGWYCK